MSNTYESLKDKTYARSDDHIQSVSTNRIEGEIRLYVAPMEIYDRGAGQITTA